MNDILEKALQLGQNKKIATEEYLVAAGEKEAASFSVAPEMIAVSNITENTVVKLDMKIEEPGYFEVEAIVPESFIMPGKRIIRSPMVYIDKEPAFFYDKTYTRILVCNGTLGCSVISRPCAAVF